MINYKLYDSCFFNKNIHNGEFNERIEWVGKPNCHSEDETLSL